MSQQPQSFDLQGGQPPKRGIVRRMVDRLFAPWMKDVNTTPYDWQQDAHKAFVEQQPLRARALLYGVAIIVVALVIWSALAEIDEVTRGQGKVIPSKQVQVLGSQDGGPCRSRLRGCARWWTRRRSSRKRSGPGKRPASSPRNWHFTNPARPSCHWKSRLPRSS